MRDSGSTMAENAPAPFKLEREVTLMPSEFRERLSAKHKSRKTSDAHSSVKTGNSNGPMSGRLRYRTENSNASTYRSATSPTNEANYVTSVNVRHRVEKDSDGNYLNDSGELKSTTSHIQLNGEYKFMLDNAYGNSESEGGFNVKTPPKNLQIKDLMIPLDDWQGGGADTIQEKKYTVLPSIKHKKSAKSDDTEHSRRLSGNSSDYSINNQLDFFRDKIEEEADFFADFRVNTSTVKATPRQDPLPPIKHDNDDNKNYNKSPRRKSQKSDKHMKNNHLL